MRLSYDRSVIYQNSLAYLLGLEGVALMRAFNGDHGPDFTQDRIAQIRTLLENTELSDQKITARPVSIAEGYDVWARHLR